MRHQLKFSIRDVLWLTVVVAMGCGWWVDRSHLAWKQRQAMQTMERLRERLDRIDPERRASDGTVAQNWPARRPNAAASMLTGAMLFGAVALFVLLVWRGGLHWSIFDSRREL